MSGWNGLAPAIARTGRSKPIALGSMIGPVRVVDHAESNGAERYRSECTWCGARAVIDRKIFDATLACTTCSHRWRGFLLSALGRAMSEIFDKAALQRWWCRRQAARVAEERERNLRGGR